MTGRYGELRLIPRPDALHVGDSFRSLSVSMIGPAVTRTVASSLKEGDDDQD
jgi:hypothetical protein